MLDGDELYVPTRANDGLGCAGDIAAAYGGGFALSSKQVGVGLVRWHPMAKPAFLAWPQPMAVDNHWVLVGEA